MGYYTKHTLEIIEGDGELIEKLRQSCDEAKISFRADGKCASATKWYYHDQHMREFSAKHPTAIFKLYGVGEKSPDLWVDYYMDGKCQSCTAIITFPVFDKNKLL